MASQSLYRKWRSQTFSDLIGQEAVVRTLLNAVRDGRLAHAYLFCGPRGTGKTSTARLLAKAINCASPHDGEPCNECVSCREITAGRSPDVIEIDAASNTGVDNIRDLRESVNLMGASGHHRVFVIDETHMLSTAAFNALLKTLEEPPPRVIFVLATTEAHKVLPTIVSRCQRFDFRRISMRDIVARIRQVAEGEGLDIDPAAADLLARAAQGGLRDALSLLDQAMAYCGTHIDLDRTRTMLGLADPGAIRRLLAHVAEQQSAEGLHLIHELVTTGADLRQLNAQLAEEWRALVLARAGANVAEMMDRTDEEAREITELANRFSLEELTACARIFTKNDAPARGLPVPQLALELSFLECVAIRRNGGQPAIQPGMQAAPAPQPGHPAASPSATPASPPAAARAEPRPVSHTSAPAVPVAVGARSASPDGNRGLQPVSAIEELDLDAIERGDAPPPAPEGTRRAQAAPAEPRFDAAPLPSQPEPEIAGEMATAYADGNFDDFAGDDAPAPYASDPALDWLARARESWELVKQVCKQKSRSVAALLHSARPVQIDTGEQLVLVLQADYQFHLEKLRDPKSRAAVEWAVEQVLEAPIKVRLVPPGGDGTTGIGGANGSGGSGGTPPRRPSGGPGPSPSGGPSGSYGGNDSAGRTGSANGTSGGRPGGPGAAQRGPGAAQRGPAASTGDGSGANGTGYAPVSAAPGSNLCEPRASSEYASGHNGNGTVYAGANSAGNASNAGSNVRMAADALPANVTPIRARTATAVSNGVRPPRSLEDEIRADAVIETMLKSGIQLADVRPLEDDGDEYDG